MRRAILGLRTAVTCLVVLPLMACGDQVTTPTTPVGTVTGTVRGDSKPVVGISVSLDNRKMVTDASGAFTFSDVPIGTHTLVVEPEEDLLLETPSRDLVLSADGEIVVVDFAGSWVRESTLQLYIEPAFEALSVELLGPDTLRVTADQPSRCSIAGCQARVGFKRVEGLRAGKYLARLLPVDEARYWVVRDTASVQLGHFQTGTVTLVVAPATATLIVGDTVAGRPSSPPAGYRIDPPAGDTVDLRFTVARREFPGGYSNDYRHSVYRADGEVVEPAFSEGGSEYWRLGGGPDGPYTVVVERYGDVRGSPPAWYGIATRPAGPVLRLRQGAFARTPEGGWRGTFLVWNAGSGVGQWSASADDARVTLSPDNGVLPLVRQDSTGAAEIEVSIDTEGLWRWGRFWVDVDMDDPTWPAHTSNEVTLYIYDPRITSLGYSVEYGRDVLVGPDGSPVIQAWQHLVRWDDMGGTWSDVVSPEHLEELGGGAWLEDAAFGPDGTVYLAFGLGSNYQLWRIGPDGSEERLLTGSEHFGVTGYWRALVPAGGNRVFLLSDTGLWTIEADGLALRSSLQEAEGRKECMVYDPSRDRLFFVSQRDSGISGRSYMLYELDPETGGAVWLASAPQRTFGRSGGIWDIAVGRSGLIYGVGNMTGADVIFTFDPVARTWGEEVVGPYSVDRIEVAEGRLLLLVRLGSHEGVYEFPVDDGPPGG
jgi:hypothetical protein